MNKKTIVKLIAVLALCFLIGGALVACKGEDGKDGIDGAAGATGPQGPQGEKGEKGDTPVITIVNGNWYVDGVDTKVPAQGPQGPQGDKGETGDTTVDTCTHEWQKVCDVTVEKSVNGVIHVGTILNVCNKCLSAKVEAFDGNHNWVKTDKEATCTEEGKQGGEICDCGASKGATTIPKKPHTMTEDWAPVDSDANICEDGGIFAMHCTVCGHTETKVEDGLGHTVKTWNKVNDASKEAAGELEGQCSVCFKTVKFVLPALSETNYDLEAVAPTCVAVGYDKYTFNAEKYTNDLAATKLNADSIKAIAYTITLNYEANGHQLDGVNYTTLYKSYTNDDGQTETAINWWKNGEAIGIQMFANEFIECDQFGHAYFICEDDDCDAVVEITAYKPHNGKGTETKPATCCEPGVKTISCDECKSTIENVTIDPLDHEYEYELKDNGTKLVGTCKNCTAECACEDKVVTETVTDAKFTVTTQATCSDAGEGTWSYVKDGFTYTLVVAIEKTSHAVAKIGDDKYVLQSEYWNEDEQKYIIKSDETFVVLFANHEPVACGQEFEAYYVCQFCNSNVYIDVIQQHVYDKTKYDVASPADCENDEKRTYTCTVAGCADPKFTEEIKGTATGHTYTSVLSKSETGYDDPDTDAVETYKFKLVSTCACGDVVTKYSNDATIDKYKSVAATCTAPGKTVWVLDGVEVEVPEKQLAHKLEGLRIDSDEFAAKYMVGDLIKSTTTGIEYFANTEDVCGQPVKAYIICQDCCTGDNAGKKIFTDKVIRMHEFADDLDLKCYEGTEAECIYKCGYKDTAKYAEHDIICSVSNILKPTATTKGSFDITYKCQDENCNYSVTKTITDGLVELVDANIGTDKAYSSKPISPNGCEKAGETEYTYIYNLPEFELNGIKYNLKFDVVFKVETDATGHIKYEAGETKTYELTVGVGADAVKYTVYVCTGCGHYVVVPEADVEDAPVVLA